MMIGHLSIAGIAELVVSAGLVAFLQKSNLSLLKSTAGVAREAAPQRIPVSVRSMLRPLWIALGILMVLTPLGILAGGSAWGEWLASDFSDPALRQQIASASFDQSPPLQAPAGLDRMSRLWTAPFDRYAPPYVKSAAFGYLLSAMFGAGLVILACQAMSRLIRRFTADGPRERTI